MKRKICFITGTRAEYGLLRQLILLASNEKLIITHDASNNNTGAGNAPLRFETVGKWANTSNQINIIDILEEDGFTLGTATQMKVWGSD